VSNSYLLDTNTVSDIVHNPNGRVIARMHHVGEHRTCVSIIVAGELRFGVAKGVSRGFAEKVEALLERLTVLPLAPPVDRFYAMVRADLSARGKPISANDMLIAAHALALDYVLVTDNVREFSRVKGLRVENWLR
jgi:tRNA(fMet)-specific endonuclease VapC